MEFSRAPWKNQEFSLFHFGHGVSGRPRPAAGQKVVKWHMQTTAQALGHMQLLQQLQEVALVSEAL